MSDTHAEGADVHLRDLLSRGHAYLIEQLRGFLGGVKVQLLTCSITDRREASNKEAIKRKGRRPFSNQDQPLFFGRRSILKQV